MEKTNLTPTPALNNVLNDPLNKVQNNTENSGTNHSPAINKFCFLNLVHLSAKSTGSVKLECNAANNNVPIRLLKMGHYVIFIILLLQ